LKKFLPLHPFTKLFNLSYKNQLHLFPEMRQNSNDEHNFSNAGNSMKNSAGIKKGAIAPFLFLLC
jgi:hypothetical protein